MDKVRSYPAVVAGSVVHAELFPEVSIADAPESIKVDENSVVSKLLSEPETNSAQQVATTQLKVKS